MRQQDKCGTKTTPFPLLRAPNSQTHSLDHINTRDNYYLIVIGLGTLGKTALSFTASTHIATVTNTLACCITLTITTTDFTIGLRTWHVAGSTTPALVTGACLVGPTARAMTRAPVCE